jgi:hypothetical protein
LVFCYCRARVGQSRKHFDGHRSRSAPHRFGLDGTIEAPHFDRAAFKVARIYATLAADGRTANFKFAPADQEFKCMLAPEAFRPVAGGWQWLDHYARGAEPAGTKGRAGNRLASGPAEEAEDAVTAGGPGPAQSRGDHRG